MNKPRFLVILLTALPFSLLSADEYATEFESNPSLQEGRSILEDGNGWIPVLLDSASNDDAAIVVKDGKKMLRLVSSSDSASGFEQRSTLRNTFETPINGPNIRASVGIGWSAFGLISGQSAGLAFGSLDYNVPTSISFTKKEGLRLSSGKGEILLMEGHELKDNFIYQFEFLFNYSKRTFDVTMQGLTIDDQPIRISHSEVPFAKGVRDGEIGMKALFLYNYRGDKTELLLESVRIKSETEL